ncbi:MAG: rod shape-determining protein, partial [Lachnospiraceae bacterium]|nr:rod shape-determining protein [Lachnospiraceae bacterium]
LKVANLTLEPIAAMLVAVPERFRLLNIALVDVGAGTSDICITKDGSITAYGMIPMAGDCLTEVIANNHLVDFNTADEIKKDAGSKKRTIKFKDIMGLEQSVTPLSVRNELDEKIGEMAHLVSEEIKKLNGGKSVSAVFVVGGGGKIPGYTDKLAKELGIQKERVALRGEEVLSFVNFPDASYKRTPELVTPIGICLNYYEKRNNFIFVNLNNDSVKLYDNNRLTVADAAVAAGFPNDRLFPRRGKALEFTLNGSARLVRGELGEAATITINGHEASASSIISPNDDIVIRESTVGPDASYEVMRLPEYKKGEIVFFVNGKNVICPRYIQANGHLVSGFYDIKQDDRLELLNYYTVSQLLEFMDIPFEDNVYVNNEKADKDTKVYENFKVTFKLEEEGPNLNDFIEKTKAEAEEYYEEKEEEYGDAPDSIERRSGNTAVNTEIVVNINGRNYVLRGKDTYHFVDVIDVIGFNINQPEGTDVLKTINKRSADFADPIKAGDVIELKWI